MKLKNKLLPLVGISAIAATATPLALTSCTNNNIQMVDISKGYTPTIIPHVAESLGQHKANQEYFGGIQTNGDIFYQDYIYGQYLRIQESISNWNQSRKGSTKVNSLQVGISTPTFSSVDIYFPGEPAITYPTISVSFKLEFDIRQEYVDTFDQSYHCMDKVLSCTVDYKNMPFYVQQDSYVVDETSTPYWYVSVPYWDVAPWVYNFNMSDWSINYSCDSKLTNKTVRYGQSATEKVAEGSKSGTINTPAGMEAMFSDDEPGIMPHELFETLPDVLTLGFSSYYLTNIVQIPELNSRGAMSTSISAPIGTTGTGTSVQLGTIYDGTDRYVNYKNAAVEMTYYMDQMINNKSGTIKLYADIGSDGIPKGDIILNQVDVEEGDEATTLTIDAGSQLDTKSSTNRRQGTGDYEGFIGYGLPAGALGKAKTSETAGEKTYTFALPKYIVAQVEIDGFEIEPQKVYLNNDTTTIDVTFA